jgi:hypothetical protein
MCRGLIEKSGWFKPWRWIYRPISWQGVHAGLVTGEK